VVAVEVVDVIRAKPTTFANSDIKPLMSDIPLWIGAAISTG
jgi:hypothetical protein